MDLPVDDVLADRYRIVERRGHGGMAVVYAAHDRVLDRLVAVKVLADHLLDDPRAVERFEREARAAARLNHPNVVAVYDAASDGDRHFLVMELVEGTTLAERLRADEVLEVDEALELADQVATGLAAAHAAGMVHRDVKPSNVLLTDDGAVKVTDFGIARAVASAATQTAVVMGSVPYVAPEQLDGRAGADPRSDLYALGCVLFECLTGRPPFEADTTAAVLGQHLHLAPPVVSERRPEVGLEVDELVAGLLAKEPDDRPASADLLRRQLARVRAGQPPGASGGPGAAVAGGLAAGADVAGRERDGRADQAGEAAEPTEVLDPAATPTEVIAEATTVLPGTATGAATGATRGASAARVGPARGDRPEPAQDDSTGHGWWIAAAVLGMLALALWAWSAFGNGGDDPLAPTSPTPSPSAPAVVTPSEPQDEPPSDPAQTSSEPAGDPEPTPSEPEDEPQTEPPTEPQTPTEAPTETEPSSPPAPTTPPPSPTPTTTPSPATTTPPPTSDEGTASPTAAARVDGPAPTDEATQRRSTARTTS